MRISVVIPAYNRAHTIKRCLDSVINQSSTADEIILIDDGSTDHTSSIIQQHYPQVKLLNQSNKGVSAARNRGIQSAHYDWIALLDSDDEWLPDKLDAIRKAHQQNPQESFYHSDEIWIRNGVRVNQMAKHTKYGGMIFVYCLPLCIISPSAAVIHRHLFKQIGLFNEDLPACEDYDLWLRLCHRFPVYYIDRPLINKYAGHDHQLSTQYWGMDRFRIRALQDLMTLPTLSQLQKKQTVSMLIKKLHILIKGAHKHENQQVLTEYQPILAYYEASC